MILYLLTGFRGLLPSIRRGSHAWERGHLARISGEAAQFATIP